MLSAYIPPILGKLVSICENHAACVCVFFVVVLFFFPDEICKNWKDLNEIF